MTTIFLVNFFQKCSHVDLPGRMIPSLQLGIGIVELGMVPDLVRIIILPALVLERGQWGGWSHGDSGCLLLILDNVAILVEHDPSGIREYLTSLLKPLVGVHELPHAVEPLNIADLFSFDSRRWEHTYAW